MNKYIKKTSSFAVVHFSVAFLVSYFLTGDWRIASALALIEPMVNTVAFYFHEVAWSHWKPKTNQSL